jgi:putative pyruvate formate lyase activating enzyme
MKSKKDLITRAGNTLYEKLSSCEICPRGCGVNRLENQEGFCRTGSQPEVSGYEHFGKEAYLVGCKVLEAEKRRHYIIPK